MSKEIREMIDKVKNFKPFVSEQTDLQSNIIYHFVDENKLVNILSKNELKPRWKHYIESVNRIVIGMESGLVMPEDGERLLGIEGEEEC